MSYSMKYFSLRWIFTKNCLLIFSFQIFSEISFIRLEFSVSLTRMTSNAVPSTKPWHRLCNTDHRTFSFLSLSISLCLATVSRLHAFFASYLKSKIKRKVRNGSFFFLWMTAHVHGNWWSTTLNGTCLKPEETWPKIEPHGEKGEAPGGVCTWTRRSARWINLTLRKKQQNHKQWVHQCCCWSEGAGNAPTDTQRTEPEHNKEKSISVQRADGSTKRDT